MVLLNEWRDDVLRDGDRVAVTVDGKEYRKGLQMACMECHTNKEKFCDSCHEYTSVKPYCWDCHLTPDLGGDEEGDTLMDKQRRKFLKDCRSNRSCRDNSAPVVVKLTSTCGNGLLTEHGELLQLGALRCHAEGHGEVEAPTGVRLGLAH